MPCSRRLSAPRSPARAGRHASGLGRLPEWDLCDLYPAPDSRKLKTAISGARREAQALEKAYHWCSAEVDGRVMRVVAHGIDHKQLDAFELSLPTGDALDALRERNPGRARRIEGL